MRSRAARRFAVFNLFVAFAFTVMADPVSSVAYAIEAALRALDGDLASLVPTMGLVVGIIALVAATYHGVIARFPSGGGDAKSLAQAFGEGWAFLPLGALLVDFTLTIVVSCAAGASAVIAYAPGLADWRLALAVALSWAVGAAVLLGHRARIVFATATLAFVGITLVVMAMGAGKMTGQGAAAPLVSDISILPMLLAAPLGMALATGVEAPSNAVAQLGQLDDDARRRFGQLTIWVMLLIVATLTLGLAALAVRFETGAPGEHSTLLADIARRATGGGALFAAFQAASAFLLLAAAASSFLAGSGLLKALALHGRDGDGLLPERLGRINSGFVPPWGVGLLVVTSTVLLTLSGGRDQEIVQFYAVAVFVSFLAVLVAMATLSRREGRYGAFAVSAVGTVAVLGVLVVNLRRGDPLVSLAASAAVSLYLWRMWVARGRPGGVAGLTSS